ncbi:MAG: BON domain-containing protein [Candidatus Dormibacterales bacterium]
MPRGRSEERLDQPGRLHHLVARIRGRLALDPRVGELHVTVALTEEMVTLGGRVATEARRRAAAQVAAEVIALAAPGLRVRNLIELEEVAAPPPEPERL